MNLNFIFSILLAMLKTCKWSYIFISEKGLSWSWSYGSWIYNYRCNQWLSPLKLWVWITLRWSVLDKVCQWLAAGQWFSPGSPVSSTNRTDRHSDIAEILLNVALNTINHQPPFVVRYWYMTVLDAVLFIFYLPFVILWFKLHCSVIVSIIWRYQASSQKL